MRKQCRGQSLMETIIALTVIVTGLGGAVTLVTYSLRSSSSTMDRLVAENLAAEGIEVVTNIRDSNYLAGDPYNAGLTSGSDQTAIVTFDENSNLWRLDFAPNSLTELSTTLFQQGGVYRQSSSSIPGTATAFKRLLTIDNSVTDQLHVTSTVSWVDKGNTQQMVMDRILYNWR